MSSETILRILPFVVLFLVHHFVLAPLLPKRKALYGILTALLLGLFAFWCFWGGHKPPMPPEFRGPDPGGHGPLRPEWMELALGILLVTGDWGLVAYRRMKQNERKLEQLRAENLHQQLEALRFQINPHFFMNTLNNIQSLILTDPDKATEVVNEFSKLLRIVLYEGNGPTIPLSREIEYLKHYIALMRLRYPESVRIETEFPDETGSAVVPPLLMASFAENAFKHGISYDSASFVKLRVTEEEGHLIFLCSNSSHPGKAEAQHGLGLDNIRKRLELLYGTEYTLRTETQDGTYDVVLAIPTNPTQLMATE